MRDLSSILALFPAPLGPTALALTLALPACTPEEDPPVVTDTETGEPSCLDSETPGEDIVINNDQEIAELQLSECIPETIIITSQVTNLTTFANVREIGRLELRFTANLTTLLGLQDLQRVDTLIITGNVGFTELPEFDDLVVENLTITNNPGLTDLGAFPAISSLRRLEISGNDVLSDYSGIENLAMVTNDLTLSLSPVIGDFTGLEGLTTVGGSLSIEENDELDNFDGLGVTSVGGDLRVIANPQLSECLVEEFVAATEIGGATITNANQPDFCG